MNPFLTQLAEVQRAEPTRAKWVIVPSHTLGHTLGERLAASDGGWTNLRFTTPLDLALLGDAFGYDVMPAVPVQGVSEPPAWMLVALAALAAGRSRRATRRI